MDLSSIINNPFAGKDVPRIFNPKDAYDFQLENTIDEKIIMTRLQGALRHKQPKKIEIDVSEDNNSYTYIGDYEIRLKPGTQFFTIEQNLYKKVKKINYIKVIIKETYGDSGESRTYINQIFFFDESANLEQDNNEVSNTEEQSYKEEDEEMSYQPIAPMKEVKKLITSENESSERIATNQILNESDDNEEEEMKGTTDNNIETEENPEEDITENEEEKEKKLRKIQKILKSKIKNPIRNIKSSPYVNKTYQEQGNIDQYLTENTNEISNHNHPHYSYLALSYQMT